MAGTSWPVLTAGSKAKASEVEAKFDWIEGSIVPMNAGSKTDAVYDIGEIAKRFNNGYIKNIVSSSITADTIITTTITVDTIAYSSAVADYAAFTGAGHADPNYQDYQGLAVRGLYFGSIDASATTSVVGDMLLPQGVTIAEVTARWYRDTSAAYGSFGVVRKVAGSVDVLCTANSNVTSGYQAVTTTSMTFSTIDNNVYRYYYYWHLAPEDTVNDVGFGGFTVKFTKTQPR